MITALIIFIAIYALFRLVIRGLFFKKQLGLPFKQGILPFQSYFKMYKQINENSRPFYGMLLRWIGLSMILFVAAWQTYYNMELMTHMYGLLLHFYEAPDYTTIWNILSSCGAVLLACGIAMRLVLTKRMNLYFGIHSRMIEIVGTLFPTLYTLYLAHSKKYKFVLHRDPNEMSREEFQLYCTLKDK